LRLHPCTRRTLAALLACVSSCVSLGVARAQTRSDNDGATARSQSDAKQSTPKQSASKQDTQKQGAQKKSDADATRKAREVREAITALRQVAEDARSFEDLYESTRAQSEAADALWPYDEQTARAILRRAWDATNAPGAEDKVQALGTSNDPLEDGLNSLTTARRLIIKAAIKHDPRLADTFMREFERGLADDPSSTKDESSSTKQGEQPSAQTSERDEGSTSPPSRGRRSLSPSDRQRLIIAGQLSDEGEFKSAAQMVAPLVAKGPTQPLLSFILALRRRDARDADALYLRLLEVTRADADADANDVLILSTPVVAPDLYVTVNEDGSADFTPLFHRSDEERSAARPLPAELRAAFYSTAASVLLRPRAPRVGGEAHATNSAPLYFAVGRLLPFFEREASQFAAALHARMSALASEMDAARRDALASKMDVSSLTPKNSTDPLALWTDMILNERDPSGREFAQLSALLVAVDKRLWDRARSVADGMENPEQRSAARLAITIYQVMDISRAYADDEADDFARAADFVRASDVPPEVRAAGLAQASELAARRGKLARADALLTEAEGFAAQADRGQERVAAFAFITLSASRAVAARVWESLQSLVRAANDADDLQWGAVNFRFALGPRKFEFGVPTPAPGLPDVFAAAARLDPSRTLREARALKDDLLRANAMLAAARTALGRGAEKHADDKAR